MSAVPTVLFICQHNAGRSQLGAHLLSYVAGDTVTATSAGLSPADAINPAIAATLGELGIDTSAAAPRAVTPEMLAEADVVVLMKPGLTLPGEVTGRLVEWQFPDPAKWDEDGARGLREDVLISIRELADQL